MTKTRMVEFEDELRGLYLAHSDFRVLLNYCSNPHKEENVNAFQKLLDRIADIYDSQDCDELKAFSDCLVLSQGN